jgi:ribosome-associated protein
MDIDKYLIINEKIAIPWAELNISFARSSGPGGQNVNKVNSKAVLEWHFLVSTALPIGVRSRFLERFGNRLSTDGRIVIASDEQRNQEANVKSCAEKLRSMILAVAEPPKIRRATKPTKASQERRIAGKKARAQTKRHRQSFDVD